MGTVVWCAHPVPLPAWTSEQQNENTALRELLRALQEILNGTGLQRGNPPLQTQIDTGWRQSPHEVNTNSGYFYLGALSGVKNELPKQNEKKKKWAVFSVYIYQNIVPTHKPKTKCNPCDSASPEIKPVFLKSAEPYRHGRPGQRHKFQTARCPSFFQSHHWALGRHVTAWGANIKGLHLKS